MINVFLLSNKNFMLKTKHLYELKLNEAKHNIYNAVVKYVKSKTNYLILLKSVINFFYHYSSG